MNIPISQAKTFLGRTDLCTMEEAVNYAKNPGTSYDIWKAVFERSDFQEHILKSLSVTDIITYAIGLEEFYIWGDIWIAILKRSDVQEYLQKTLLPVEAVAYAKSMHEWRIWEIITSRSDVQEYLQKTLSSLEAIMYAKSVNDFRIWEIIFHRNDITPREIIAYAKEIDYQSKIWETIFNRSDIVEYLLNTLSPTEAIKYAEEVNYWRIWNFLFEKRTNLSLKEAIVAYLRKGEQKGYGSDFEPWGSLEYGVNKMREYLSKKISSAEAFDFAKEVNCWKVWEIVLGRSDISSKEAINCAKDVKHTDVWKVVLGRNDVPHAEAFALAKEIDDSQVWEIVLKKE